MDKIALELLQKVVDAQKNLLVIFLDTEIFLTNSAFNTFFGLSETQEYKTNYGPFIDNFVPHPSYFNKSKIMEGSSWIETISTLSGMDRVVSMMNPKYEPHAFSVSVSDGIEAYTIVTFENITQTLIKSIMIENKTNIDVRSGAYDKKYFMHIQESYEDAARYNEKIITLCFLEIQSEDEDEIIHFVESIKSATREDDMIVQWSLNQFLLLFLVDDTQKAEQVSIKLKNILQKTAKSYEDYKFSSFVQNEGEKVASLLRRMQQSQD